MAVKLIIDAGCDLTKTQADALGVILVPMTIHFEDMQFQAGYDITHEVFFDRLAQSKDLPTTSQPTPYDFECAYKQIPVGDEGVVICISSALSGTYQSACIAAEEYTNIKVVDTQTATIGERILLDYALLLSEKGMNATQISSQLERVKERVTVFGAIDTLEYLIKGGRLSKVAGIAGSLLGIRPVLTIKNGVLEVIGKARGTKASYKLLNAAAVDAGIDFSMPTLMGFTGKDSSVMDAYTETAADVWEQKLPNIVEIGSTIGTHTGPGLIGIAFFKKI